tara:strand:- start:54 stop:641 length:588 start_codon:yes stop_codon:yes gene_type:complete
MKNLIKILFLSIFIFSCNDKYEIIDKETRFNVSNGEIEILLDNGNWIKKSNMLKTIDEEKKKKEREEYEKQQKQLLTFPYDQKQLVNGTGWFYNPTYSYEPVFDGHITNDSNWKIEEIEFNIRVYNIIDSTKLRDHDCTVKLYSDYSGVNGSKTDFEIMKTNDCGLIGLDKELQYFEWSIISIRGYDPSIYNPNN